MGILGILKGLLAADNEQAVLYEIELSIDNSKQVVTLSASAAVSAITTSCCQR